MTWLVKILKVFIRRTEGSCGAMKESTNDVLRRSVKAKRGHIPRRHTRDGGTGVHRRWGVFEGRGVDSISIGSAPLMQPQVYRKTSKEKGKLDMKREKERWRAR
jgi:hypothetical protein